MRVVVTGVGVVSPLGIGAGVTMDRLVAGDRALGKLRLFEVPGIRSDLVAEVPDLSVAAVAPRGDDDTWSRTDAMAALAAREALASARLDPREHEVDLVVGGTTAGMFETEELLAELARDPEAPAPLRRMLSHPLSATSDHVHAAVGPFRRARALCSACSGGANAILLAATWLLAGRSRRVLAGGADALCRLTLAGFGALAALDPAPCRPFDRRRAGLNLGEGAAMLLLETEEGARARGAAPIVELRGYAIGAEAHHITNPAADGRTAARVMQRALERAGIAPADLDYVNAHGTATPLNDVMETAAIRACLGDEAERVPVSSSKGQIGHTLGAAGAIEAVITALAIARQIVPPTAGLEELDPACRLVHVTTARPAAVRAAMSSSFGFGGTDTAIVLARPGLFPPLEPPRARRVVVTGAATIGPLGVLRSRETAVYLEPGLAATGAPADLPVGEHLDLARARRLDRSARLATIAVRAALVEAGALTGVAPERAGAIVGSSFGSVDASTAYMRRIYEKGAKYASPADFPNLVPSSPAGHASIYLGLEGPVFAVADLAATADAAITTAAELVAAGEADLLVAGSVEEASRVVERVVGPACSAMRDRGPRGEGASVLVLEAAETARARGARPLATIVAWTSWRGDGAGALAALPARPARDAWVLVGRVDEALDALIDGSAWASAERRALAPRVGDHEGASGFAAAAAVALLADGRASAVLVVGAAPDRGYAVVLASESGADGPE
jgi:3-oxoacyl-[acyl-carrier-protein] synthase II